MIHHEKVNETQSGNARTDTSRVFVNDALFLKDFVDAAGREPFNVAACRAGRATSRAVIGLLTTSPTAHRPARRSEYLTAAGTVY